MSKNYQETVDLIRKISLQHPFVNDFFYGRYNAMDCGDINYGAIILTPEPIQTTLDIVTFNFNLMYVDRLQSDESNEVEIQSVGIDVIRQILNVFSDSFPIFDYEDGVDINVFSRQFSDNTAGAIATVQLIIPSDNGECTWYCYEDEC